MCECDSTEWAIANESSAKAENHILNRIKPRIVAKIPKNFVTVKDEPNTKTETIAKITKFAEYIAALYPGLGARFIDFIANTVAVTEQIPIKIAIITERVVIENSIFGAKIKNIETAAAHIESKKSKKDFLMIQI